MQYIVHRNLKITLKRVLHVSILPLFGAPSHRTDQIPRCNEIRECKIVHLRVEYKRNSLSCGCLLMGQIGLWRGRNPWQGGSVVGSMEA